MHEIYKGMDNAAEQIDNNFKGIKDYIIEQGDNDKGWWEKWASGKLVQYGSMLTTHNGVTERWGNIHISNPVNIVYPIPFWDIYALDVNLITVSGPVGWLVQYYSVKSDDINRLTTSPPYTIGRPESVSSTANVQYDFKAIGRWKAPDGWEG